jgi:hypothetical protein
MMVEVKNMENLLLKIRISILWIFIAVAGYRCTSFFDPGILEQILAGEWIEQTSEGMLLFMAFFWLIPFLMAFLTVTLKEERNNRWTNIILGIIFVGLNIFHFAEHALIPTAHQLIIVGATVIAALLIVWYAWKWPKAVK